MIRRYWFFFVLTGLVLMNACQKEYSLENGSGLSQGSLQDDGAGDCLPKTVAGAYAVGVALNPATNYIEVTVDVTTAGTFVIYTDTLNGMYFRATGSFANTGVQVVRLRSNGTPTLPGTDNFIVFYGTSGCTVAVTTTGALASFTLAGAPGNCTGGTPAGTYTQGVALTSSNTITVNVDVTVAGAYTLSTALSNGMVFAASGIFANTGSQSIVLTGTGTPTAAGVTNIPITAGSSTCSLPLTVQAPAGGAAFTMNCGTAVVNGTYTVGTPLGGSNTITLSADVTTTGTYTITGTINGMTFTGTGSFAATGPQNVTLAGTGTPTTAGTNNINLTGGTAPCNNIAITVSPAAGAATFTVNCAGATVNGTYTVNTALAAGNTITLPVNVTGAGSYTINATLNGMTFSATGNFAATGTQNVTLAGSGTPTASGLNSVPVTGGTAGCNIDVNVNPAAGGAATFTANCATATVNGTYTVGTLLGATNTITLPVNVTVAGTYNITATLNGMSFSASGNFGATGTQNVTLNGTGTPTTAGANAVPVNGGTGTCNVNVTVNPAAGGAATFTANCAGATVNGTYTVGTALTAANTITLPVNVTVAGTYSITATLNGMTFAATGNFPTTGTQNVTLNGTGNPSTAGANAVPVNGGTGTCNVTVNVNPASTGAVFTIDCSTAALNGYLTKGVAVAAVNTIEVDVNVTTIGTYTISIPLTNGFSYTATGTFTATGVQTVTLNGTGTPTNAGDFTLTLNGGTAPCTFDVTVDNNYGTWTLTAGATNYSGTVWDVGFDDQVVAPGLLFYFSADNAPGDLLDIILLDQSGAIAANEQYKCFAPITGNTGILYFEGINGTSYSADPVIDPTFEANTLTITVTTHNTATKNITGTFTGQAFLNGGTTLTTISGTFNITYP